jgi:hypothetical protein
VQIAEHRKSVVEAVELCERTTAEMEQQQQQAWAVSSCSQCSAVLKLVGYRKSRNAGARC